MATSLKESKKDVRIEKIHAKIMKIGLVDPEIALLMLTSDDDGQTPHNSPRWARPDAAGNSVTPRAQGLLLEEIRSPSARSLVRRKGQSTTDDVLTHRPRCISQATHRSHACNTVFPLIEAPLKLVTFDEKCAITRKRYKIDV